MIEYIDAMRKITFVSCNGIIFECIFLLAQILMKNVFKSQQIFILE